MADQNYIRDTHLNSSDIVGPMRIVITKPGRRLYCAAFLNSLATVSNILIGAVVVMLTMILISKKGNINFMNAHIVLCSFGYQLLLAESILSMSSFNGWSALFKIENKKIMHYILGILAMIVGSWGTVMALYDSKIEFTNFHKITGLFGGAITLVCTLTGILSHYTVNTESYLITRRVHALLGIAAFLFSSLSFAYGLLKKMKKIQGPDVFTHHSLIAFIGIYTLGVILVPCLRAYTHV